MAARTVAPTWKHGLQWYARLRRHHVAVWKFVEEYVVRNGVKRVIEVGGGAGHVASFLPYGSDYVNIEVNAEALRLQGLAHPGTRAVHGSFLDLDLRQFAGEHFDLLLTMSVLEHMAGYERFFEQADQIDATRMLVTFFVKMGTDEHDRMCVRDGPEGLHYRNTYSRPKLEAFLRGRYPWFQFTEFGFDSVLEIQPAVRTPIGA